MEKAWFQPLKHLFDSLGQDPIEDAPSLMDITANIEETSRWMEILDMAIFAAQEGDSEVVSVFRGSSGYTIQTNEQALSILNELRQLYVTEIET